MLSCKYRIYFVYAHSQTLKLVITMTWHLFTLCTCLKLTYKRVNHVSHDILTSLLLKSMIENSYPKINMKKRGVKGLYGLILSFCEYLFISQRSYIYDLWIRFNPNICFVFMLIMVFMPCFSSNSFVPVLSYFLPVSFHDETTLKHRPSVTIHGLESIPIST